MDGELSKKIQEQGRMSTEEHSELFEKTDLTKESRERLEQAQKDLKGHLDKKSQEVYKKLEYLKSQIKPLEQIHVNQDVARRISERTEQRLRAEIKKGNIPQYDVRKDTQMLRWLKK